MNIHLECIPCTVNSYLRLVKSGVVPASLEEEILRRLLEYLSGVEYDQSPPVLGRKMHRLIRECLQDADPYRGIKERYNRMMLELYPEFGKLVERSADPFDTAMRLAIAGNVIDLGPQDQLDVPETLSRVTRTGLAIDDSRQLRHDLEKAGSLLYIGDNCGEIVLDKLFLSCLDVPEKYFAVRGHPVINDAAPEDAVMTGMAEVARVITTGDDAPGAVWESSSKEFKDVFKKADVVISKGQGNLEGLMDVPHKSIYFLLVTKCDLIAHRLGTGKGEFIVKKGGENENFHSV